MAFVYIYVLSDDGHTKPQPRKGSLPDPTEYKCLVRASLANKKISTVVSIIAPGQERYTFRESNSAFLAHLSTRCSR